MRISFNLTERTLSCITLAVLALSSVSLEGCGDNSGGVATDRILYAIAVNVSPTPIGTPALQLTLNDNSALVATIQQGTTIGQFGSAGLKDQDPWKVAISQVPEGESCSITSGGTVASDGMSASGTIDAANVTIQVSCSQITYALSGIIQGYSGSGLQLVDATTGQPMAISAAGNSFVFVGPKTLHANDPFNLQITNPPSNPTEDCLFLANSFSSNSGSGTVSAAQTSSPQSTIVVSCGPHPFALSGTLSGYAGSNLTLVLHDLDGGTSPPPVIIPVGSTTFNVGQIDSGHHYELDVTDPTHSASGLAQDCILSTAPSQSTGLSQNATIVNEITATGSSDPIADKLTDIAGGQAISVSVVCKTKKYSVYVSVKGLDPDPAQTSDLVVFDKPNGARMEIQHNIDSQKVEELFDGTSYGVTLGEPTATGLDPSGHARQLNCYVQNQLAGPQPSGVITGGDIATVSIQCQTIGRYLYVTNPNVQPHGSVIGFSIDPSTGVLTPLGGAPASTESHPGPLSILQLSAGSAQVYGYVANFGNNYVTAYSIDNASGQIVAGAEQQVPNGIIDLWAQPVLFGSQTTYPQMAYVSSYESSSSPGAVTALPIGADGTLGMPAQYPAGNGTWGELTFTLDHKFAYQANQTGGSISVFSVDQNGALTSMGTVTAPSPIELSVDRTNRFLFALNYFPAFPDTQPAIYTYAIGADGGLSKTSEATDIGIAKQLAGYPYTPLVLDPTGTLMFVVDHDADRVSVYRIGTGGTLDTQTTGGPYSFPEQFGPVSITLDNSGKFAYVLYQGSCTVGAFQVNLNSEQALGLIGFYPTQGIFPFAPLTVDASGAFLYIGNTASGNIGAYAIDPNTGALTPVPGAPFQAFTGVSGYACGQPTNSSTPTFVGPGTPTILQ